MKKITILLITLACFTHAKTQKVYFIYLQSENQQPFYARMGEKVHNSTSGGYLILSKLRDSTYSMNIGVQGSQTPEQSFSITVNKKDQGYLLKNFGESSWGLFNFQSLAIIRPVQVSQINLVKTEKRESNSFTDLLAKAADDSTLKERPVMLKMEEKKPEDSIPSIVKQEVIEKKSADTVTIKSDETEKPKEIIIPQVTAPPVQVIIKTENEKDKDVQPEEKKIEIKSELYSKSSIIKKFESSTTEGLGVTFIDTYRDGGKDTIRILIPSENQKPVINEEKTGNKKFLEISSNDTVRTIQKSEQIDASKGKEINPVTEASGVQKINLCNQIAMEEDFFRLRKKMAAETTDENMINEAKKVFKLKCFTTEQVKNLSSLFLIDEGKYKFFDASYSFVADLQNFKSLQIELKEEYYINRFKAMLQ